MPHLFFVLFNLAANQPQILSMTDWLLGYKVEVEFEYKNQKSHTKVSSWRNLSKIALVFMRIRSQFKFVCIGRRSFIIPLYATIDFLISWKWDFLTHLLNRKQIFHVRNDYHETSSVTSRKFCQTLKFKWTVSVENFRKNPMIHCLIFPDQWQQGGRSIGPGRWQDM